MRPKITETPQKEAVNSQHSRGIVLKIHKDPFFRMLFKMEREELAAFVAKFNNYKP